ncbi:unnamed protein product [Caenorhabditis nigoni]
MKLSILIFFCFLCPFLAAIGFYNGGGDSSSYSSASSSESYEGRGGGRGRGRGHGHGHGHGGRPRPPRPPPRPRPPREKTNCPADWMLWRRPQGNWCAKAFVAKLNHPQAEAQCNALGAKLTGFQTDEERMKMAGDGHKLLLLNGWQHGNIWLGAKSKPACPHAGLCAPKDAFYWTDGQTTGTDGFGWAVRQPDGLWNGVSRQACAHQYVFASGTTYGTWSYIHGQLDDQWCSDLNSFSANKMYACGKLAT